MVIISMLFMGYWLHGVAQQGVKYLIYAIFWYLEERTAMIKRGKSSDGAYLHAFLDYLSPVVAQ